jgi:hypothetical protein
MRIIPTANLISSQITDPGMSASASAAGIIGRPLSRCQRDGNGNLLETSWVGPGSQNRNGLRMSGVFGGKRAELISQFSRLNVKESGTASAVNGMTLLPSVHNHVQPAQCLVNQLNRAAACPTRCDPQH